MAIVCVWIERREKVAENLFIFALFNFVALLAYAELFHVLLLAGPKAIYFQLNILA